MIAGARAQGTLDRLDAALAWVTEAPAAFAVAFEVALLLVGVVSRFVFDAPLTWSDELASIVFLWLGMLGAAIAQRRGGHMRMSTLVEKLDGPWRDAAEAFGVAIPALFLAIVLWPSVGYASDQAIVHTPALDISEAFRAAAAPVGVALMLAGSLLRLARRNPGALGAVAVGLVAAALALKLAGPAIVAMGAWNLVLFFVLLVSAGVLAGAPIAFCFGLATVAYLMTTSSVPLGVVSGRVTEGMSSIVLLAVPLFILLGHAIVMSRMAGAMVDFLAAMVGHVRGGLSYVLLGAMLLVSGISGAKTADMAAVAPVLFPDMKRRGIPEGELVSLLAASGAMAETVPPSIVLIVIGSVTGVSIAALFTGGLLPGVVLALALAYVARRRMADPGAAKATWGEVGGKLLLAAPALALPVAIRFAVADGIATATEVGTIGVAYVALVAALLRRPVGPRAIYRALVETAAMSGAILFIIGAATAMAWALTQANFSGRLATALAAAPGGKYGFLLGSITLFATLGSVLEGIPAMVLFGPLLFPVARGLGVNEVHYAIVVVLAMGVGLFAPPFGLGYYAACTIGEVDPAKGMRPIWSYLGALMGALLLVAFVPWISTGFL
ncbi:MAG: TRAP transporter large permease subunit [Hyphomicrobiales bacterium]|nr:TRAP transporter large permease subunit [Hyphomicrobiales bacterium]MDE2016078.1 TRAP transporter large permease subunit [Hyphomicrobiales bacterium]